MRLTRTFKIPYRKDLDNFFRLSKDLYNKVIIKFKEEFENNKFLSAFDLMKELKNEPEYKELPAQTSQQIIKVAHTNISTFFKALKDYKKNPHKYSGRPEFPNLKKDKFMLIYTNQQSRIDLKERRIKLGKVSNSIIIPKGIFTMEFKNFKQIRLRPKNGFIYVDIIYESEKLNPELNENLFASIDLGVNNLVALITNTGDKPILINGKPIKSLNSYFNKEKSKLMSIKDKMGIKGYTRKLFRLEEKRDNIIKDKFHKISRYIINYLLKYKISTLVIGKNKDWKREINIGKKNNRMFTQIPFEKLIQYLIYKAEKVGIKVILTEESYTSKADALSLDPLKKTCDDHKFSGKRILRGLYQSAKGVLINADINGALNIARKVFGDGFISLLDNGCWLQPVKIRLL